MSESSPAKKALGIAVAVVAGVVGIYLEFGSDSVDSGLSGGGYVASGFGTDPPVLNYPEEDLLVKRLKAAYDAQGVCYGWRINDNESGSHLGAPAPSSVTDDPACQKYVEFIADYTYNSVDDEFTSVTYDINSSLANPPTRADLNAMGIGRNELLDEPNVYVTDAIGALPMLVAEKGEAPAVPAAQSQDDSGSDRLEPTIGWHWVWIVLATSLLGVGLIWLIVGLVRARRKPAPKTEQSQGNNQRMGSQ